MKGIQINNLVKTIDKFGVKVVPMKKTLKLVDDAHISMLTVERLGGMPVFGVEQATRSIKIKDIMKMNIDRSIEYETIYDENDTKATFRLESEKKSYEFNVDVWDEHEPTVPIIDNEVMDHFDIEAFEDFIKSAKNLSDFIEIRNSNDGMIRASVETKDSRFKALVGANTPKTRNEIESKYAVDYFTNLVPLMGKDTVLTFDTDYPCKFTWTDGYYRYNYLLAPRIEC